MTALLAVLVIGTLSAWWMIVRADQDIREVLLVQTRLAAGAVDLQRIQALTGTEADLARPEYLRLKEQLAAIRSANSQCHFAYLVGRKADGTVFFLVDSEPPDSESYSPPGQVYEEVSASFLQVFDAKTEAVEGPVADRWGTWVSALVPLIDPQSGTVAAVLGMDIDAGAWTWDVVAKAALPVGLVLMLLIGATAAFAAVHRVGASPKPVRRRLSLPLTGIVVLPTVMAGMILWQQHRAQLSDETGQRGNEVVQDLKQALDQQAVGLSMAAQPIAADVGVQQALREGDTNRLLATWGPVFETMRRESRLTHFYFFDANRVCLLRVHKPEKRGDRIDRLTALEAERTGRTASGLELGPLGTFTLRVVQPVFDGHELVGYLELGKEIEDVLQTLCRQSDYQVAVALHKEAIHREAWEAGMRMLGREADWARMPHSVIIYASRGRLSDAFVPLADHDPTGSRVHGVSDREIASDGKDWRATASPLQDASGKEVGCLLVMNDITAEKAAFVRIMTLGGVAGVILLTLLLSVVLVLLRRTDQGIHVQQAELRESEARYALTLAAVNDGLWDWHVPSGRAFFSATYYALLDYGDREFPATYDSWRLLVHPDDLGRVELELRASVEAGRGFAIDLRMKTKAGLWLWVCTRGKATEWDSTGKALRMVGTLSDITERKRTEEASRRNEARLESLMRITQKESCSIQELLDYALSQIIEMTGSQIGYIYFYDEERREFTLNTWSKGVMEACSVTERLTTYQLDKTGIWGEAVRQRRPIMVNDFQAPHPHKKGCPAGHVPLSKFLTVPVFRDQKIVAVVGVANKASDYDDTDVRQLTLLMDAVWKIVDRRRAEEAAKAENAKLSAMISGMDEGVVFANADNVIVEINEYLCRFVGRARDQIIGKRIEELHHGPALDKILAQIDRFRAVPGSPPLILQRPLGSAEVVMRMQPIYRDGAYDGVLLNVVDVTELVRARQLAEETNRQLGEAVGRANQMAVEAELANATKSAFLANMSHEIRTPMTAILGFANLVSESLDEVVSHTSPAGQKGLATQREHLRTIQRNGEHLLRVINDILDLSKIEAGKMQLERVPCQPVQIVEEVASLMRVRAIEKGLSLGVQYEFPLPLSVLSDPVRLRQILVNLVGNAVKFTTCGSVEIVVRYQADASPGGPHLVFEVRDTGIGLTPEQIDRLFQPFTQADSSTTRQFGGTGLGLAICRKLVEALGGNLHVASQPGEGSTFTFTMEATQAEPGRMLNGLEEAGTLDSHLPRWSSSSAGRLCGRVLLAEDGLDNQVLLSAILRHAGAQVDVASNGRVAVDMAIMSAGRAYDAILMDMQMPEMDGYEATERLRQLGYQGPIVALTAHAMSGDRQKCLDAGCDEYVTKPVDRRTLLATLAGLMGGLSSGSEDAPVVVPSAQESSAPVLYSDFRHDSDMMEIVGEFVSKLPERLAEMRQAAENGLWDRLQRMAHQMKGAGGGYGYSALTEVARELETHAKGRDREAAVLDLAALTGLCRSIQAGVGKVASPGEVKPR
jgi:PAS domain S-box-containing protein